MNDPANTCPTDSGLCTFVYDHTQNMTLARAADWLIAKPLAILVLILIALVVRWLACRVIDRLAHRASTGTVSGALARGKMSELLEPSPETVERRKQRADTMASLLKSIATAVIFTIVLFMVISQVGYDIGPLLASAGIIGIALGFGAQSLVKDFLNGIFMIMEDQYGVGDAVNVGAATGVVEAVGLRVTRLRDVNGTVWYVRNGEMLAVGNMSQSWSRVVLDIPVPFSEDVDRIRQLLDDVAHEVWRDPDFAGQVIEEPEVWGVERWDPDGVALRVVLKTAPDRQSPVAREVRRRVKAALDAAGIDTQKPQRVVWHRDGP